MRYAAMVRMMGRLSTEEHSYAEINRLTSEYGIKFSVQQLSSSSDPDVLRPVLEVVINCLSEDMPQALSTAWEILTKTSFDENDIIRHITASGVNEIRSTVASKADQYALYYANAITTASGRYSYETSLVPYLRYIESVSKMDDNAIAAETTAWQNILDSLMNRTGLSVTIVSGTEGIDEAIAAVIPYTYSLPCGERTAADYSVLEPLPDSIAVIIPGSANYNLKQIRADKSGVDYTGKLNALAAVVKDKILIPVMRYKNGVYSPKIALTGKAYYVMAYRDPSIAVSYDEVMPALGDTLRGFELTQQELDSYIISAYSSLAMPVGPIKGASIAVADALCGNNTFEDRESGMESLRSLTPEDLAACSGLFDTLSAEGCTVTVGSAASIEAEASRFDMVETWFVSSTN